MIDIKSNQIKNMEQSKVKCVIVGDSQVGKSAICKMYASQGNQFPKTYNMTSGVELIHAITHIQEPDLNCHLFIYDSSGKNLYHKSMQKYWREPNIILVVFDLTSRPTLESASEWVKYARSCMPQDIASNAPGVLFGNKSDLYELREVSQEEAENVAEKLSLKYLEGSAKDYKGVDETFKTLLQSWYELIHYN